MIAHARAHIRILMRLYPICILLYSSLIRTPRFVLLPACSAPAEAVGMGKAIAARVTDEFPEPMKLQFERVCRPLLLVHVNRYREWLESWGGWGWKQTRRTVD